MKKIIAIDIEADVIRSDGVAYYRLTKEMVQFMNRVYADNDVIGFEYEPGSFNMGVIVRNRPKVQTQK